MMSAVSNAFALLLVVLWKNISMRINTIASSSATPWLASGRPKLNRGRMDLSHPVAFFIANPFERGF